jgi:hypothetical protein
MPGNTIRPSIEGNDFNGLPLIINQIAADRHGSETDSHFVERAVFNAESQNGDLDHSLYMTRGCGWSLDEETNGPLCETTSDYNWLMTSEVARQRNETDSGFRRRLSALLPIDYVSQACLYEYLKHLDYLIRSTLLWAGSPTLVFWIIGLECFNYLEPLTSSNDIIIGRIDRALF